MAGWVNPVDVLLEDFKKREAEWLRVSSSRPGAALGTGLPRPSTSGTTVAMNRASVHSAAALRPPRRSYGGVEVSSVAIPSVHCGHAENMLVAQHHLLISFTCNLINAGVEFYRGTISSRRHARWCVFCSRYSRGAARPVLICRATSLSAHSLS